MRSKIIVVCTALLAGCSYYRVSTGKESSIHYSQDFRLHSKPAAIQQLRPITPFPGQWPAGDTEQKGPQPEIDGTRNWGHDILPIGPALRRDDTGVYKI